MSKPSMLTRFKNLLKREQRSTRTLGSNMTPAGVRVDHDVAMTYHAVWAAVRCIAETVGVLNMHVFQMQSNGGTKRRSDLQLDRLLRRRPNPWMSAMTFREVLTAHALTWGNGYAEIEWDNADRPIGLWPLAPDRIRPVIDREGVLWYEYHANSGDRYYIEKESIFHLKGFGFDGMIGYDVISYFVDTIGHALAVEKFSSSYFGNGTHLSGGLFSKRRLSAEARNSLREEFVAAYSGPRKAFRMGVFEEGLEWKPFGLSPEASKLIESRQISVEDVARIFRVPLHKIGHLLRATNNNIEHQGIEYVVDTILPWATRWEQEADSKLLSKAMQKDHYTKLNVATLMRGDMKSRYEAYKIGREWGWLNANQIAELEDLEPIGEAGDIYIVPLNYQSLDTLLNPPEPQEPSPPAAPSPASGAAPAQEPSTESAAAAATKQHLADVLERAYRRERAAAKEAFKAEDRGKALDTMEHTHQRYVFDLLKPFVNILWNTLETDSTVGIGVMLGPWCQNLARSRVALYREHTIEEIELRSAADINAQFHELMAVIVTAAGQYRKEK